jgi:transcriptional regulator GlxA family with amidase domain
MAGRLTGERRIVIAVYNGVSLLDVGCALESFRIASEFACARCLRLDYKCSVVSSRGGKVKTADGVVAILTDSIRTLDRMTIDTLIVPGAFLVEDVTKDTELIKWVAARAPKCRRVCSVCVGSFLLAAAGIINGRRAATHWMHAPLLAKQHPDVRVEPDAIFVRDGRVWSSAGATTGIDMALALIEEDGGRDLAIHVARMLIARVYAEKRGRTPAKAVEAIRLDAARRRLEETDDRIETIAYDCGYGGEEQIHSGRNHGLTVIAATHG